MRLLSRLRDLFKEPDMPDQAPIDPSNPIPPPAPAPVERPLVRLVKKYGPWLASAAVGAIIAYLTGTPYVPPPLPQQVAPPEVEYVPTFGWVQDPAAIEANADPAKTLQFANTDAGKLAFGDDDADVYLWRLVRKAAGHQPTEDWYPNVNQEQVGCCVGCGNKHSADVCLAAQVSGGKREEWKPVAVEPIYGGSRVEVGGGQISGDGSVGRWAADWLSKRGGLIPMEKLPDGSDLTVFSPAKARQWGRTGVPDALEPLAKNHPVKSTALVRSADEGWKAIGQAYPIAVCSNQGFRYPLLAFAR